MDKVNIEDIDLDIQNYIKKAVGKNESLIYFRTENKGERIESVNAVYGNVFDLADVIVGNEAMHDIIMYAAAYKVFSGDKLDDYLEDIKRANL